MEELQDTKRVLYHLSDGKESACNVGDSSSIARLRRFPREGKGYPL